MIELRVCIDVPDIDRGIEFYSSAFGLAPGRRFESHWVEMLGAMCPIDLLGTKEGTASSERSASTRDFGRHWTPVHIDIVVEDLDAAVARAVAAGATLDRPVQSRVWGRQANLADPFGNGMCLLEMRGRGYDALLNP
jgi:predicted enzyme related to lactoylglutathione lyase